jgi:hypothetical protein
MPGERDKLEMTCEAESLLVMSTDRALLERLEALVREAVQSEEAILRAIVSADPDMLE